MVTTEALPRARGSDRTGPLQLVTPPRRGRFLGLEVGQIVAVELALAAVVSTVGGPLWLAGAVGGAALVVVVLAVGRRHGRWWYQSYSAARRLRRRRAERRADGHPDPRMAGLRELAPELTVRAVADRTEPSAAGPSVTRPSVAGPSVTRPSAARPSAARPSVARPSAARPSVAGPSVVGPEPRLGVAQDAAGWFAVVELAPAAGVRVLARPALPLGALAALLDGGAAPLTSVQVVVHTVPAPVAALPGESPALASYRSLLADGAGGSLPADGAGGSLPADEVTWIAVRLDSAAATEAAHSRGGGVDGVHRALTAGVGRVGQILTSAEIPYRLLDADGLLDALARSCGIADRGLTAAAGEPRTEEDRRCWRADGNTHVSFWIRSWPPLVAAEPLLARLTRIPADAVTLSLTLSPEREGVRVQGLVRLTSATTAARGTDVESCADALAAIAGELKLGLQRQDGEHAPAVYASAPTGGGPRA